MKIIRIITLLIISGSLFAQDSIGNKKKKFLVANLDYLYNEFSGHRIFEFYPGATTTTYTYYRAENTSGLLASLAQRRYLTKHSSMQLGIGVRNTIQSYSHNDSIVNQINSPLQRHKIYNYRFELPVYYSFYLKRFSFLSGIIIPIANYKYSIRYYKDGTTDKYDNGITWGGVYLSEKAQFNFFKKQNIGISIGCDFSPNIFKKYYDGYLINWNIGVLWMIERKKKVRKIKEDDYVQ